MNRYHIWGARTGCAAHIIGTVYADTVWAAYRHVHRICKDVVWVTLP